MQSGLHGTYQVRARQRPSEGSKHPRPCAPRARRSASRRQCGARISHCTDASAWTGYVPSALPTEPGLVLTLPRLYRRLQPRSGCSPGCRQLGPCTRTVFAHVRHVPRRRSGRAGRTKALLHACGRYQDGGGTRGGDGSVGGPPARRGTPNTSARPATYRNRRRTRAGRTKTSLRRAGGTKTSLRRAGGTKSAEMAATPTTATPTTTRTPAAAAAGHDRKPRKVP